MRRPRRLRISQNMRALVRENKLTVNDLIYPLFIKSGTGIKEEIASMPDQYRYSVDTLMVEIEEIVKLGIKAVLLFGLADHKDDHCKDALNPEGVVQAAIKAIKASYPDLIVMTDVCVCAYTTHGHCGVLDGEYVDNDKTLQILAAMAVSHAKAGADVVAPSAMMDMQVGAIRHSLDKEGFSNVAVMGYSAKYYSAFYGPFRDAADSSPQFGDRASYQMDAGNSDEAIREMGLDVAEGADIIMVKPALSYLDIIRIGKDKFDVPMAAYNVSGEYSMIKLAGSQGLIDEEKVMLEMLLSMKRAGSDLIITYFAKDAARILKK